MKLSLLALVVLLSALPASAGPKKHFWTDKKVLVGEAIIIGSTLGLDATSTCHALRNGTEAGGSLVSTCGQAVGVEAAAASFYTLLNYAEWHFGHDDPNRYWRFTSYWSMPAAVCAIHCTAAIHNFQVTSGERKLQSYMRGRIE